MNLLRQLLKSALTTCVPRERLLTRGPRSTGSRPRLALTFDDGPHPVHTPAVLERLERYDLRATFFVIGQQVERYPDLILRMTQAGHEVANHTYSHSEPSATPASALQEEVLKTDAILLGLTGSKATTFRPPKGELSWSKLSRLWQLQKTVALWNVDPKDYRMTSMDQITAWCRSYRPSNGDIVLLHDVHPYAAVAIDAMAAYGVFDRFETTTISHWLKPVDRHVLQLEGA